MCISVNKNKARCELIVDALVSFLCNHLNLKILNLSYFLKFILEFQNTTLSV